MTEEVELSRLSWAADANLGPITLQEREVAAPVVAPCVSEPLVLTVEALGDLIESYIIRLDDAGDVLAVQEATTVFYLLADTVDDPRSTA
jgi:hypothetical protein